MAAPRFEIPASFTAAAAATSMAPSSIESGSPAAPQALDSLRLLSAASPRSGGGAGDLGKWQSAVLQLALQQLLLQLAANPFVITKLLMQIQHDPELAELEDAAKDGKEEGGAPEPAAAPDSYQRHAEMPRPMLHDFSGASLDSDLQSLEESLRMTDEERRSYLKLPLLHKTTDDEGYYDDGGLLLPYTTSPVQMMRSLVSRHGLRSLWRGAAVGFCMRFAHAVLQPSLEAALNDHLGLFDEGLIPLVFLDSFGANLGTHVLSKAVVYFLLSPLDVYFTQKVVQKAAVLPASAPQRSAAGGRSLWARVKYYYPAPLATLLYYTVSPLLKNLPPLLLSRVFGVSANPWVWSVAAFGFYTVELVATMPLQTICRKMWAQRCRATASVSETQGVRDRIAWLWRGGFARSVDELRLDREYPDKDRDKDMEDPDKDKEYATLRARSLVALPRVAYRGVLDMVRRLCATVGGGGGGGKRVALRRLLRSFYQCLPQQSVANLLFVALAVLSGLEVETAP